MILGRMPYVNVAPYYHFLSPRWLQQHTVKQANPRQLGELARAGQLDAAPFSLVDAWDLVESGEFEWIGDLGIAGKGPIQSILLVGVHDPASLGGQGIRVSPQTATTVRLLEIWLRQRLGVLDYTLQEEDGPGKARLLIGDEALRVSLAASGEPAIDLCQTWTAWTGLPFVFARWAMRKSLSDREKRELLVSLSSAVDLGMDDIEDVVQAQADRTGLPSHGIDSYLRGIRYRLKSDDLAGLEEFKKRLSQL